MSMFKFNPANTSAGDVILPKGDYVFKVGEPKVIYSKKDDGTESYGILLKLTVSEGEFAGKSIFNRMYLHWEGADRPLKQFMMAAFGFSPSDAEQEAQFNEEYQGENWDIDFEQKALGEVYMRLKGTHVIWAVDVQTRKDDPTKEQQRFGAVLPYGA